MPSSKRDGEPAAACSRASSKNTIDLSIDSLECHNEYGSFELAIRQREVARSEIDQMALGDYTSC